ncbi:hypothetical protein NX059_002723 [Plenodomus lindquistii]|nr:hypothetical protein NX059_002723 [Plenodomus lindquistii]
MPGRLQNKIAVITGSSSGIGRATALAFASEGASVVCSDLTESFRPEVRTDESALNTVQEIEKKGGKAIFVKCDITSTSDMQALIAKAVETYGRLDIMVNNAGMSVEGGSPHGPRPVWEFDEAAFDKTFAINVKGVFLGLKYATAQMIKQEPHANGDRGWIINLASVFGLGGGPGLCEFFSFYLTSPWDFCFFFASEKSVADGNSGIRSLQTRSDGPHESRSLGLRTSAHPC